MRSPFNKTPVELPGFWKEYEIEASKKLPPELESNSFVVLDTETTGFSFQRDRMLSIGALTLKNGVMEVNNSLELYLKQERFDHSTVKIHGLLKKETKTCVTEYEAMRQLLAYVKNSVIVGHHTHFDISMINKALKRQGLPELLNRSLDTALLYPKSLIKSPLRSQKDHYTLDDLAEAFDISLKDRHTALGDAYITAIAFLGIIGRLQKKENLSLNSLFKLNTI
ncbi:3'-5' exonuclease [Poritiphilus flavus]|uniref:3'-5' exonuclease n=1 Tax=Poritiphilus flavus TaxID=2697053 RepID=A0A6L9EE72_9FLAO|nr:3'-5' exonuclease [Poritiphilus flavus]NAS12941.1 3'-5' exonuclease [Poritiphilus flavus]